jgi:hypothetical protein
MHPSDEDIILEVLDAPIRREGDWWYVPVRPNRPFPKTYQYYEELTDIEEELRENEQLDVFLVPAG